MKKKIVALGVGLAALVFAGCSSIQTASPSNFNGMRVVPSGTPVQHISATCNGLYFFIWPLITGSIENPGLPTVLKDTANPTELTDWVTKHARKNGASRVLDLTTSFSSVGFIFYMKQGCISGTAVK
ncbi:MAG: hypothetical protein PHS41_05150 [Victivallaceae bacterium]|nr:hypothetical protein [Victivallaceae bacterium]